MTRPSPEQLFGERQRVQETLTTAVLADPNVVGAFLVGSVAADTADEFSDIDMHMHVTAYPWPMEQMRNWMTTAGIRPNGQIWNGYDKHLMLVENTRLDLHVRPRDRQTDLLLWPQLHFSAEDVIKDADDVILKAIAEHKPQKRDPENDYHGYVLNLIDVAHGLSSGERIPKSYSELIESKARMMRELPIGAPRWMWPLRHAEEELRPDQLAEIYGFFTAAKSNETLRALIVSELSAVVADTDLSEGAREVIEEARSKLTNSRSTARA